MERSLKTEFLDFFRQISDIPRPSGHEEKVADWLRDFANARGLRYYRDQAGNSIIYKDGVGEPIMLQAHTDMVCEKLGNVHHDFLTDGIDMYEEDGWMKARGTTLGADDGIGCAYMLALLDSSEPMHPLECLFTIDEETGLTGAFNVEPGLFKARRMINLDSEDENIIYVGCAGGCDTIITLPVELDEVTNGWFGADLQVSGLLGGHSGDDIEKKRANAVSILTDFIYSYGKTHKIRIVNINAGGLINAIARESTATVAVPFKDKETLRIEWNIYCSATEDKWIETETAMRMHLDSNNRFTSFYTEELTKSITSLAHHLPHGPMAFYPTGAVELSTNLAYIRSGNDEIVIGTSQRSADEAKKRHLSEEIQKIAANYGAFCEVSHEYPGWEPDFNSKLAAEFAAVCKSEAGFTPTIKSIHAGLECGLLLQKYPELDMISVGPLMQGVHTPSERLNIESAERMYKVIKKVITI